MIRARIITFAGDLPQAVLDELEESAEAAAWVADLSGGGVLAATTAGAELLGLAGTGAASPRLDAAMPALSRLRTLAAETPPGGAAAEPLTLWTPAGATQTRCRITFHRADALLLAVVRALAEADPSTEEAPHARDEASAAARALRAALAHELKTPLNAIAAAAEIMKDQRFGPLGSARYADYAADIHGSAQHVLRIIERMLDDSLFREGEVAQSAFDFAEIDTADVLAAVVSQLRPLAERAGIALTLEHTPRLPHIIADATSLRQIVLNLVTNALKFTDRGGYVTIRARYDGEGPLSITIADTGRGMSEDDIARALAREASAEMPGLSRSMGSDGLGLGLPLVQKLAQANGAQFALESTPGQGTSATVIFDKGRVVPV